MFLTHIMAYVCHALDIFQKMSKFNLQEKSSYEKNAQQSVLRNQIITSTLSWSSDA